MVSHQVVGCWIQIAQMKLEACQKPTRAVHIELIEAMSTDSFINTLRRFFSIRGTAKLLRSDRGANFVGTCRELDMATNDSAVTKYLQEKGCSWAFNRAHASHMGGSWERLIGDARRFLDAILLQKGPICLTHEILSTFNGGGDGNHQCKTHCFHINRPGDAPCSLPKRLVLSWPPLDTFVQLRCMGSRGNKSSVLLTPFGTLQSCRKRTKVKPNVRGGDVVLLKDSPAHRNE